MLFAISVPSSSDRGLQYAAQALAGLSQGSRRLWPAPFVLEFGRHEGQVGVFLRVAPALKHVATQQLTAAYPEATVRRVPETALDPAPQHLRFACRLRIDATALQPTRVFDDQLNRQTADPLAAILNSLSGLLPGHVALEVVPLSPWRRRVLRFIQFRRPRSFWNQHLFVVRVWLTVAAPPAESRRARRKLREIAAAFGPMCGPTKRSWIRRRRTQSKRRPRFLRTGTLISAEQLTVLWHPATAAAQAESMHKTHWREIEAPVGIPDAADPDISILGQVAFRGRSHRIGLDSASRRLHVFLCGKTGTGKSSLLLNMLQSDVLKGRAVGLLDPHGDLCQAVLESIPSHRTGDVVLLDAGDRSFPVAFNPLDCPDETQRPLAASAMVSAMMKVFDLDEATAPRLLHILRNSVLTLLETPGSTLLSVIRLLNDAPYRKSVTSRVSDPLVRHFWQREFAGWHERYRSEAAGPVLNKLGALLTQPQLRSILGQERSSFQMRELLDRGNAILLCNLSKGQMGEDASRLLGALLLSSVQQAAMSRSDLPEEKRSDFLLSVDEAHNFTTASLQTMLAESRKYRCSLTFVSQHLGQWDEATLAAILGNCGSLLAFQVGSSADVLAEELGVEAADLRKLPRYLAYARLPVDGVPHTFSMRTLPPRHASGGAERAAKIVRCSRQRYGRSLASVEQNVERTLTLA